MTEIVQGSPEWFALRCGKATASRIADILAKTKSGPSAMRANYAAELIAERLTGTAAAGFTNAAMQWGTEKEPEARAAYIFAREADVDEIGFVHHPRIEMSGASPDGLVGKAGLVEIKCPNTATHIDALINQSIPGKYVTQMQWQMACTGRDWCDFVSFDPRLPPPMQLFVKSVARDQALIEEMEREVESFLGEVAAKVDRLLALYARKEAA
jgi:putative phage-type endonuclease